MSGGPCWRRRARSASSRARSSEALSSARGTGRGRPRSTARCARGSDGVSSSRASARFRMFPVSTNTLGTSERLSPPRSERTDSPFPPRYVAYGSPVPARYACRMASARHFDGRGDVVGQPADRRRIDDVEAAARRRPAVGVDRDGGVRVRAVADRCPLGDARSPAGVRPAREDDVRAGPAENPPQPHGDVEGEGRLRVARRRRRSRRVAGLAQRARVDEPVDLLRMRPVAAVVAGVDRNRRSTQGRCARRRRPDACQDEDGDHYT